MQVWIVPGAAEEEENAPREIDGGPFLKRGLLEETQRRDRFARYSFGAEEHLHLDRELSHLRGATLFQKEKGQLEKRESHVVVHLPRSEFIAHCPEDLLGFSPVAGTGCEAALQPTKTHQVEIVAQLNREAPDFGKPAGYVHAPAFLDLVLQQVEAEIEQSTSPSRSRPTAICESSRNSQALPRSMR